MSDLAAFSGTYADWKLIKTRSVVQVVFEIPVENSNAVLKVLGGMPDGTRWFGIAPLSPTTKEVTPNSVHSPTGSKHGLDSATPQPSTQPRQAGAKRDWRDIPPPQQAGIRCADPIFAAFLKENHPEDWREGSEDPAECVRVICAVTSRADLATHANRVLWHQLDTEYQAWKALEHA